MDSPWMYDRFYLIEEAVVDPIQCRIAHEDPILITGEGINKSEIQSFVYELLRKKK